MKKLISLIPLLSLLILTPLNTFSGNFNANTPVPANMPGAPVNFPNPAQDPSQMTEEQLLQWQQEVDTEIAKFVSTLPPEQQEQFHKDVAELTKVMEGMSEDELGKFIDDILAQEAIAESVPQPLPVVEEKAPEVPTVKAPAKTPSEDAKMAENTDKALKMLTNLITRIERFLRKANSIPELAGKIEKWVAKDKVKEWQVDLTWTKLKADIDALDQKLHTIKESLDPKTKKYRYINDLVKNESLFNNLNKLSTNLTTYEPKVEIPAPGATVSKDSRTAIKETLSALAEAIYTMDIPKELNALIEKYEPRAKELRDEEAATAKKALDESKVPRKEAPKKEVGSGKNRYVGGGAIEYTSGGGYAGGGYGGGYAGGNYGGGYAGGYPSGLDATYGGAPSTGGGDGGRAGGSQAAGGKGGAAAHEDDEDEDTGAPKKDGKKDEGKKPVADDKKEVPEDSETNYQLNNIRTNLDRAIDALETNNMAGFEKEATSAGEVDTDLVRGMVEATRYLKKTTGDVKGFNLGLTRLTPAQKDKYTKQIKSTVEKYKGTIEDSIKQIKEAQKRIIASDAKSYAYFADNSKKQAAIAAEPDLARLKQPAKAADLLKELESFLKETEQYRR